MATTRIIPLHIGKGRTVSTAISDIIDYVKNPEKTDNGKLITGYQCDSRTADAEFLLAKRQYIQMTGRVRGEDDVIAYQIRQSFVPGEITPEEANRLGRELAQRFTKGNHAYIVCTHIDKAHIHNHIIWNAVNLECDRKFRNFWGSTRAVRRLNDTICIENGYSIVENPKAHGKSYNKWLGDKVKLPHREVLRMPSQEIKEMNLLVDIQKKLQDGKGGISSTILRPVIFMSLTGRPVIQKKFLAEHEADILIHKAAKKAFDELGVKKIPTVKSLQTEYAQLLDEKKRAYGEYRQVRGEMKELLTVKANVDQVLGMEKSETEKEKEHGQR